MYPVELQNNEFLRQFETSINGSLARIEYAEQERKIFVTKIHNNAVIPMYRKIFKAIGYLEADERRA